MSGEYLPVLIKEVFVFRKKRLMCELEFWEVFNMKVQYSSSFKHKPNSYAILLLVKL